MIKFGEVSSFVQAVAVMRQNQKKYTLHKDYNNLMAMKSWEEKVDAQLKTLNKNIEKTKKEMRARAQPSLLEGKDEAR